REGVILPGYGGGDRIPALLEPGEAVVPARVVRGGLSNIVAWFRSMGVTKMKDGGIAGILATATPREALVIAQAEQEAVSREMTLFANRMLEGMQEITNTMAAFIFGAAQMIVDVLKALFPEAADSIQKGFDDFKAWWERSFRQERKAAAQAPEEAAPTPERTPAPTPTAEERSWWERLLENTQELVAVSR